MDTNLISNGEISMKFQGDTSDISPERSYRRNPYINDSRIPVEPSGRTIIMDETTGFAIFSDPSTCYCIPCYTFLFFSYAFWFIPLNLFWFVIVVPFDFVCCHKCDPTYCTCQKIICRRIDVLPILDVLPIVSPTEIYF